MNILTDRERVCRFVADIVPGERVNIGVKVHFGRTQKPNSHIPPDVFSELKVRHNVTFFDTNTLYGGERGITSKHLNVAKKHGFYPAEILDESNPAQLAENVFVPRRVKDFDIVMNAAHFTGHKIAGYGGCIKNIAMGMVTAKTKLWVHAAGVIKFNAEKCKQCGWCGNCDHLSPGGKKTSCTSCAGCIGNCSAVHFTFGKQVEVAKRLVEVAYEVDKNYDIKHLNYIDNPTKLCDCMGDSSDTIIKKIFAVVSGDIVEVEDYAIKKVFAGKQLNLPLAQTAYLKKMQNK